MLDGENPVAVDDLLRNLEEEEKLSQSSSDSEDFMKDTKDIEESSVDDELSCNMDDL